MATHGHDSEKQADVTTPLKPHQQRIVDRLSRPDQSGLVAVHGLGSGKTLSSIAAADALDMPTDVVTPAALTANFEKELDKHTDQPLDTHIQSLENVSRKGPGHLKNPFLIVDEAHRLRNPGKARTALMSSPAQKRLLLTGSLFYNHPADMAAPINIASGKNKLPMQQADFERQYIRQRYESPGAFKRLFGTPGHLVSELDPKEAPYLKHLLNKYVDYHPGSAEGMPTREDQTVEVPMEQHQRKLYDAVMSKAPNWVGNKVLHGLPATKAEKQQLNAFLTGVRQVSNTTAGYDTRVGPYAPKIDRAVSELQSLLETNPKAKALVYSNYLDSGINPYKARLDQHKIPYGEFSGQMTRKARNQLVRDYNDDKLRALLVSSAGGEGLDLKGTRLIQLLEPHWNEEKLKQVIGRGIRFKSHDHLPEEERNVRVQRFLSTRPRSGLLEHLRLRDPGGSVDQYLHNMGQDKERLNQQFRDLLQDGSTYSKGAEEAKVAYGLPMEQPTNVEGEAPPQEAPPKKSWLPALGAAAIGGLGAYKLLRSPTFSNVAGLRKLQMKANAPGADFNRVVTVATKGQFKTPTLSENGLGEVLTHHMTPVVDPKTKQMNLWNKLKFKMLEGTGAVPVVDQPNNKAYLPGTAGRTDLKGTVYGRTQLDRQGRNLVPGGADLEGNLETQHALTDLGMRGKLYESKLLSQHAPDATPRFEANLARHLADVPRDQAARVKYVRQLQQNMRPTDAAGKNIKDFLIKPDQGLNSGGNFIFSGKKQDWGNELEHYYNTLKTNPALAKKIRGGASASDLVDDVWSHKILGGKTLHDMLDNPSTALLQEKIKNPMPEWRVHTMGGAAPLSMMAPRGVSESPLHSIKSVLSGDVDPRQLRQFAQETLAKMPKQYREGQYGMDVMPFKKPDGSTGFKVVEMNPHERAGYGGSVGGGSGVLDSVNLPGIAHAQYRAATGRHTRQVAGLAGLGAAGLAGGAARMLTPEEQKDQDDQAAYEQSPHPAG